MYCKIIDKLARRSVMSEILEINGSVAKVGKDDGSMIEVPIATFHFPDPKVGDKVRVYRDGNTYIVKREESTAGSIVVNDGDRHRINKIAYILLTFFLGFLGVHRFMRGQIGIGIIM